MVQMIRYEIYNQHERGLAETCSHDSQAHTQRNME